MYYLKDLFCPIKQITVYLKRKSKEIIVDQYNKVIYLWHRANKDIQLVTDPCCQLCVCIYAKNQSCYIKNYEKSTNWKWNKFQNVHEVSAPEAVYTLLLMPVAHASRETFNINTIPFSKRMDKEMLEQIRFVRH